MPPFSKYFLPTLLTLLLHPKIEAQQEQMYTQFMVYKSILNPAANGTFESPMLIGSFRNQWTGIDGAPKTRLLSFSRPFLNNKVGFGTNLSLFTIGISRYVSVECAYAYRVNLKRGIVSVGIQPGIRQIWQNWNDNRIHTTQPVPTDGAIPSGIQSKVIPNVGFGCYYAGLKRGKEKWFLGVSIPRLVKNNIDFAESGTTLSEEIQHFYLMTGYNYPLKDNLDFSPNLLFKYVRNAPLNADLNLTFNIKQKYIAGVTYRTGGDNNKAGESVDIILGLQTTKNLFLCASYDVSLSRLRKFSNGTIELTTRWWFNPPEGSIEKISKPNI
jgi:type IX secretion system PorP/SprF family membrane protein